MTHVPRGPLLTRVAHYVRACRAEAGRSDVIYALSTGLARGLGRSLPVVLRVPGDYAWERSVNRGWVSPLVDPAVFEDERQPILAEALKALRRAEVKHADYVIAPSDYVRALVVNWGAAPERVRVIPSAPGPRRASTMTRADARRHLGWPATQPTLMCAARLTPWKGIDFVLEALSAVPDARLVVCGDGPARESLEQHARRLGANAEFVGTVPRSNLPACLAAADYLVMYSGYEGLSHTIVEALDVGTPVIASRRGGNPEIVRDRENGLLVDFPSVDALRQAFRLALAPGMREQLGAGVIAETRPDDWPGIVGGIVSTLMSASRREELPASAQRTS